ncbi:MAG: site-specific integrase [Acidobacteriota bacterium]|nr:site-specific integrase [Acidobacteriota bacterium]
MARMNNGTVKQKDGLFYPRVRWTDEDGKDRDYKLKPARTEPAAWKAVIAKKKELETGGAKAVDSAKMKFSELAEAYRKARLYPAKIVNGKKVGGVKSLVPMLCSLQSLTKYFGNNRIQSIRHSDLEAFKQKRLETPTIHGKQRAIASVNRELELARAIFKFAIQERLIVISPFVGMAIIAKEAETRRERILSDEEESRLLAACRKPDKYGKRYRRLHLIPLLIAAWDTAARRGELMSLTWENVNFEAGHYGTITVIASKCKTERERTIGMTPRLRDALLELWEQSVRIPNDFVFGYKSTPKTAFMSACTDAGIKDYRWHDGRHTATTRMMEAMPNAELVKKITGHTQSSTFERYYNPSTTTITSVAEALAERNKQKAIEN